MKNAQKYIAPHKPQTRLSDIRAKYAGKKEWSQVVVDDKHLHGEYIYAPGAKVSRRFHPDTRAWWIVMDGQIRFEIEGQEPFGYDRGNKPHFTWDELTAQAEKKSGTYRSVHDDRAVANAICGYEKNLPRHCLCAEVHLSCPSLGTQ